MLALVSRGSIVGHLLTVQTQVYSLDNLKNDAWTVKCSVAESCKQLK